MTEFVSSKKHLSRFPADLPFSNPYRGYWSRALRHLLRLFILMPPVSILHGETTGPDAQRRVAYLTTPSAAKIGTGLALYQGARAAGVRKMGFPLFSVTFSLCSFIFRFLRTLAGCARTGLSVCAAGAARRPRPLAGGACHPGKGNWRPHNYRLPWRKVLVNRQCVTQLAEAGLKNAGPEGRKPV